MSHHDRFAEQKAKDALAFDPLPKSKWVTISEGGIVVKTLYSEALSSLLRALPGAKWRPEARAWIFPFTSSEHVRHALPRIDELASTAADSADKETLRREGERALAAQKHQEEAQKRKREKQLSVPRPLEMEYLIAALDTQMYSLSLEAIGDNTDQLMRRQPFGLGAGWKPRYWVAQIMGSNGRGGWIRVFLSGDRDYLNANGIGSRGIMVIYRLQCGPIYEVSAPRTWKSTDRYFVRIEDGAEIKMTAEEVSECLVK